MHKRILAFSLAVAVMAALPRLDARSEDLVSTGKSIYRHGVRPDGTPVAATVQQDVALPAGSAACATCHRRSGIGIAEGGSPRSLNLTGPALFSAADYPPVRPAYDEQSLIRAVSSGVSASGRRLDDLMPRFALSSSDADALVAYLRSLGAEPSPGVTETELSIATIVSTNTQPRIREAIEAVLGRFVEIKNSGTRHETERAAAAQRHYYGRNRQRAHRDWRLSIWELAGPAETWPEQLDRYYAEDPPFAVVSGDTAHDWQLVHEFCSARELACILPLTDVQPEGGPDFYTVYFSAGVELQARVTAAHLFRAAPAGSAPKVLVLTTDDERGRAAADAFVSSSAVPAAAALDVRAIPPDAVPTTREWARLLQSERPDALITWLGNKQLRGLSGLGDDKLLPEKIYTAAGFTDVDGLALLPAIQSRLRHVYPYSLPPGGGLYQFPREQTWLAQQQLSHVDPVAAAKVLFAAHVFGEGLTDIQTTFSREYLLESFEHSLDQTEMTSLFPNTTIGPDQRFISRGAYVLQLGGGDSTNVFVYPTWVVP